MTDAHSAHEKLDRENENLSFSACWTHARRRFAEAVKALPKEKKDTVSDTIAHQALPRIAAIYHLDNELSCMIAKKRCEKRKLTIQPLIEAYFVWLKNIRIDEVSSAKTKDGISYSLNRQKTLRMFLEDGEIPLDNNATERALRSFCLYKLYLAASNGGF